MSAATGTCILLRWVPGVSGCPQNVLATFAGPYPTPFGLSC
ncbi:hypothetical protein [Streptomyces sp. CA-106131]